MFGDNQSVITSSTLPHSLMNKRHNALSYHRVREAVAADVLRFHYIKSEHNPADMLSKHGGYPQVWPLVKPLLFWRGDTTHCSAGVKTKGETHVDSTSSTERSKGECQNGIKIALQVEFTAPVPLCE
jgi:hypothetical protein